MKEDIKIGWIDVISKMYRDLHNTKQVMHSSSPSDKKRERLIKYFNRLDELHKKVSKSKRKSDELLLKNFYYKLYIIKEENIEESYFQNQVKIARERGYGNVEITEDIRKQMVEQIINDQKESLDKWIEYFLYDEESKTYEMWEKYWVFQGIQTLGKYDKETGKFSRRNKSTIYPFPPVEREYVYTTLKLMEDYIKDKTTEEEINGALGCGNFKQLYEYVIKQSMLNKKMQNISTEGMWIKYEQGSDYNKLRNSLQGYYTGWCTAAGENFAKTQLEGGDFYVYYSLNENKEAKVPRIAIRMDGKEKIGEIRGIANNQNMEVEMIPILNEKLKEFPDKDEYLKKEQDMNKLTLIDNKINNNDELSKEELKFLYEVNDEIIGFGYNKDPRIDEIKSKRNVKKDYAKIYNIDEDEIAISQEEYEKNFNKIKILVGNLNLGYLTDIKDLKLPFIVTGYLDLSGLVSVEDLVCPKIVGEYLDLSNLKTVKNLILPRKVGDYLDLSSLILFEKLTLPESVDYLNLKKITSVRGLVFSNNVNVLNLESLITAEDLVLPKSMDFLNLNGLTTAKNLKLPKKINFLALNGLNSAEGLLLPYNFDLNCLSCKNNVKDEILEKPNNYYMESSINERIEIDNDLRLR